MWFLLKRQTLKVVKNIFKRLGININWRSKPSFVKIIESNNITVVLDVGSNSGQFAKILREYGYKKKIVSFEPTKVAHKNLIKSSLNDSSWVVHPRVAIGDKLSNVKINIAGNNGESSSILEMGSTHKESAPHSLYVGKEDVDIITIDSIYGDYIDKNDNVMLKIDVQGYEDHVLIGTKNNISNIKIIKLEMSIVSLYEGDKLFNFYFSKLESLGFKIWDLEPGHRKSTNGRLLQFDAIFVKNN